ncbi:hypothetical protein C1S70_14970 (plasmid) [Azospirillum argentinense]|uniref:Uncharacterized protein n=1 Tax=Azospirillum argentinense TaxID=2970906 RepID=A0A2K1G066_9PROT|nr:hypothetical protein C1S70_14970 [Azospirillum argentinense]
MLPPPRPSPAGRGREMGRPLFPPLRSGGGLGWGQAVPQVARGSTIMRPPISMCRAWQNHWQ